MGRVWIAVGLGGALGTGLRAGISLMALETLPQVAYLATLLANCLGSALIGYLATRPLSAWAKGFWMAGFCGGFTTFSMFSLEIVLLMEGSTAVALAYGCASLVLWVLSVWGGWRFGQR
ncbi:MAG: fluoride efflux transporter FluC [Roseinatronobacter sp.]